MVPWLLCSELRYISPDAFLHLEHGDKELADIAYNHCETVRQVCTMALQLLCHARPGLPCLPAVLLILDVCNQS